MKFTPEIIAALETLKNAAENDFERHRIDVLKKDLTEPPKVEVINEKYQKFNGVTYYKNTASGHYQKCIPLHYDLYRYYFGEIPPLHDVHHLDLNPANNELENLQLLTKAEHRNLHRRRQKTHCVCEVCGKEYVSASIGRNRFCSKKCANKYSYWHQPLGERICPICGKKDMVPLKALKENPCCSKSCGAKYKRMLKEQKKLAEQV